MAEIRDAGPAPAANPGAHDAPATPAGLVGAAAAAAGVATLVISLALPWYAVTKTISPAAPLPHGGVTSWTVYPLEAVTNCLVPLLLLPAVALVVSTLRSLRSGDGPTGDAVALAILGIVATVVYAFLLALASMPFGFMPGHTVAVTAAPALGLWVALAGSILALAGVIAARILARRAAA